MKKLSLLLALLMILLCGCHSANTNVPAISEPTTTQIASETTAQAPHEHTYNETVIQQVTCATEGRLLYICSCGSTKITIVPATGDHNYVDNVCTGCNKLYEHIGILNYNFLYDTPGFAGGKIEFKPKTAGTYTFYWGDKNGKLANHTMLYSSSFKENTETTVTIQSFTAIPKGATRILAVGSNGTSYAYNIPESRLMTATELYSFGSLSDTHQGDRYGSTSLPYSHFIDASEFLYKKGAITIGICGDFSYDNEEYEYKLHADAIKEIYATAPDMPIFTTSGNHEAKYTGFSREWYLEYTRNLVSYNSDLKMTFSDGNTLDYVVELPDGSVMIFLHQIYYDYGKTSSRLLDDSQLDWLGARLEQYKDRTVFLYFHTFMDEEVGDASSIGGGEYGLPLISSTVDYKRLDTYFKKYTNVIFFSGHSHLAFDSQFVTPKKGETNYDKNIDDKNGTYATMVHIPSCAAPRTLSETSSSLINSTKRSEGYLVHVYENYIIFEGYDFVNDQTISYATYIIEK